MSSTFKLDVGEIQGLSKMELPKYTTAGLPSPTGLEGTVVYDTTTDQIKVSDGTSWLIVGPGGSGITTVGTFGTTPNADGASISGSTITLQPADGTNPGGLSATTQTIGGNKTLTGSLTVSASSGNVFAVDTDTLVVDATNNRIGIGTNAPWAALSLRSAGSDLVNVRSTGTDGYITVIPEGSGVNSFWYAGMANTAVSANATDYTFSGTEHHGMVGSGDGSTSRPFYIKVDGNAALKVDTNYNTSLSGGLILANMTTTVRDAITGTANGMQIYNTTTNKLQAYENGSWVNMIGGGGSGVTTVGSFSGTANADGLSISGTTITAHAADATNPGMINASAQTLGGTKTFDSAKIIIKNTEIFEQNNGGIRSLAVQANAGAGSAIRVFPPTGQPNSSFEFFETSDLTLSNYNRFMLNTNYPIANTLNFVSDSAGSGTTRDMAFQFGTTEVFRLNGSLLSTERPLRLAKYATGSIPAASGTNEGAIVYDDTTNELKYSTGSSWVAPSGGGGGMSIGGAVTSGTTGSVLFVDGGNLQQDNSNFFWDNSNNRLGIGTATPASPVEIIANVAFPALKITNNDTSGSFAGTGIQIHGPGGLGSNPSMAIFKDGVFKGAVIGYDSTAFGLRDGLNLEVASTKNINFRQGSNSIAYFGSGGDFFVDTDTFVVDATNNRVTVKGSPDGALVVDSTDSSGSSSALIVKNNVGGFGVPDVAFYNGNTFVGNVVGYNSTGFGLVNGLTLSAPSGKSVGIRTSSTTRFVVDGSGNMAVDTDTLYVDAANNRIGIGTASPAQKFEMVGGNALITNNNSGDASFVLSNPQTASSATAHTYINAYDGTYGTVLMNWPASHTSGASFLAHTGGLYCDKPNGMAFETTAGDIKFIKTSGSKSILGKAVYSTGDWIFNAGVGIGGVTSPAKKLDVLSTASESAAKFGVGVGGLFLTGTAVNDGDVSVGSDLTGGNWTARATDAGILAYSVQSWKWYINTGLTSGSTYSPTERMALTTSGLAVSGKVTGIDDPTAAQDAATKNYVDTNSGPTVLSFGATSTANTDTTEYIWPSYGQAASATEIGVIIPKAGKISRLYIKAGTGPAGDSIVFTVRKNGTGQSVTATLAAAGTSASDTTNSFTVAAGDEVTVESNPNASITAGAANLRIGLMYTIN